MSRSFRLRHGACLAFVCLRALPGECFVLTPRPALQRAGACVDSVKRYASAGGSQGKAKIKPITAYKLLQSQGFGSRKWCKTLIETGYLHVEGEDITDPNTKLEPTEGLAYRVGDDEFQFRSKATVLLNKPVGYECSQKPRDNPTVFELLPAIFQERGMQPVGRLDVETSGALLFTDDGQLNHALCSPKRGKDKVYVATCKHALDDGIIQTLLRGVELKDEPGVIVRATAAEKLADDKLSLTLVEGKYHQVRRMIAAAGNRCEALHRSSFAGLEIGAEGEQLGEGQWRWVGEEELVQVLAQSKTQKAD